MRESLGLSTTKQITEPGDSRLQSLPGLPLKAKAETEKPLNCALFLHPCEDSLTRPGAC